MKRKILLTLAGLFAVAQLYAQSSQLSKGWKLFSENKYDEAEKIFLEASRGAEKAAAFRALSLCAAANGDDAKTSSYFYEFYKVSNSPSPYLKALWSIGGSKQDEKTLEFLNSIIEKEDGKLKAYAYQALGAHYQSANNFEEAKQQYKKTRSIDTWAIVGEFDNISESGFNKEKEFGVLDHPEKDYEFTNKRGIKVKWFDLKQPRIDNWVDFEYHFYANNSIIYAQNFCNSPKEQEVQFRIGTSGSLKLWLNDHLLFKEPKERNNGVDTYIFTAKLTKGFNRILIQIGASEIDQSNFMLRITDNNGIPIEGLSFTAEPQPYNKNYSYESKIVQDPTEAYFLNKIKENPDDIESYMTLTQFYLRKDYLYEAKKILKQASQRYPDCSYILYQYIETFARDGNRNGLSEKLEEIKSKDPNSILTISMLYDEAIDIEDYEKAQDILDKIEKRQGQSVNVINKKIQLARLNDENEELLKLAEIAYEKYPNVSFFTELKYSIEKNINRNDKKAIKILKNYLKENYSTSIMYTLASEYFGNNDISKGIEVYEELTEKNPISTQHYSALASVNFMLRNYNKAESYLKECIKIAPYAGTYYKTLADTYQQIDQMKTIDALNKAIYYNPYDYDSREKLRKALEKPSVFDDFSKVDAYKLLEDAPNGEDYPEDNSVIIHDEVQKVVYEKGVSEEKHILVVKVFNTSGVDDWKEYSLPIYSNQRAIVEKVEVVKANGTKLQAQTSGSYVVFPNLEPGDGIYVVYRVRNYYSGQLAKYFWDKHYFNYFLPVLHSKYSIKVPDSVKFNYLVQNRDWSPKIAPKPDGTQIYTWEMEDLPSLKYEISMPSLADAGITLHISSFESWDDISNWYADIAQAKAKDNFEVQEVVSELFKDKENLSNEEIVKTIYEYIVNNIRYISVPFLQSNLIPQKASKVLTSKQGDCKDVSTLFVAMCKAKGIDADLVLINTKENGKKDLALPNINFNHCIARIELDEKEHFVELTSENLPFSSGSSSIKNVFALVVPHNSSSEVVTAKLINPETRVPNMIERKANIRFDGSKIIINKENVRYGEFAASIRNTYENEGEKTQYKKMLEAISDEYPNVQLLEVNFTEGLNDNNEFVKYQYKYEAPSVFMEIGGLEIFKLPWSDSYEAPSFLSTDERKYDIELWKYFYGEKFDEIQIIEIPEGKQISEVPDNIYVKNEFISYSLIFKLKGSELEVRRQFEILNESVPAKQYQSFKADFGKIVKADAMQLGFKS